MAASVVSPSKVLPEIIRRLNAKHPDARYELDWETPLQLLVGTILAAQWTDENVNKLTPALFRKYPDARAFAKADVEKLAQDLKPATFHNNKARSIHGACKVLVAQFGGEVPRTMDEMLTLPGVARKSANVVLNNAFRLPTGVIVDTHVARVSQRMGLTTQTKPEKIETDLMKLVPKDEWVQFGPAMVLLGRYTCKALAPDCANCVMNDLCPKVGVAPSAESKTAKNANKPTEKPAPAAPATAKAAPVAAAPAISAGTSLAEQLPEDWRRVLAAEFTKPYWPKLEKYVAAERKTQTVFPPVEDVFNAFRYTPYDRVKVLLLGQDPYHDDGQAHGLCFSVRPGVKTPPSLVNIYKELQTDLGCKPVNHGYLTSWARQGVMLLNAVMTVRAHTPGAHKDQGWETFTDAVIRAVNAHEEPVVFLLWGAYAQKKKELIDAKRHTVLATAHPSPLSAKKFFGSQPFSQANAALEKAGRTPIEWQLPTTPDTTDPGAATAPAKPAPKAVPAPASNRTTTPAATPAPVAGLGGTGVAPVLGTDRRLAGPTENLLQSTRAAGLLPECWRGALSGEFDRPYFRKLEKFLDAERPEHPVVPEENEVFNAFRLTPLNQVRVVLLGDEPPATAGHADGLALSVRPGVPPTPTLSAIFQELRRDLGCRIPTTGCLTPWARQGVLLLNEVLTVREDVPGSHADCGWEQFTDAALRVLDARPEPVVFLLWGELGERKRGLITEPQHVVVTTAHPEEADFVGSRPFSEVNEALELRRRSAIFWQLFSV